jgi:RNA polymerase sigma-70 factor, ECF subfamily
MTRDERDKLRLLRSGDPGAFDEFYAAFGDRVYRFCYRLTGRRSDAEDLTQEAFLAAYQGIERFEGRSSLTTWLYRIALYRWHRTRLPEAENEVTELGDMVATPANLERDGLTRMSLERGLACLPDDLREAFLLVKAEGLKYREAAEALGAPQGTVQWRVHEATARLRVLLADEPDEPMVEPCRKEALHAL